jgi:hypothetical protein
MTTISVAAAEPVTDAAESLTLTLPIVDAIVRVVRGKLADYLKADFDALNNDAGEAYAEVHSSLIAWDDSERDGTGAKNRLKAKIKAAGKLIERQFDLIYAEQFLFLLEVALIDWVDHYGADIDRQRGLVDVIVQSVMTLRRELNREDEVRATTFALSQLGTGNEQTFARELDAAINAEIDRVLAES